MSRAHTDQVAALSCLLVFAGCSLTVPVTPDGGTTVSSRTDHAPAEEIWRALAHAVESHSIESTTRLAQYVSVLATNGELSETDVAAFDSAFPGVTKQDRALTSADARTLRNLIPADPVQPHRATGPV